MSALQTLIKRCGDMDITSKAAAELEAKDARITELTSAITRALQELRSTSENWREQCLFNCNDILEDALKASEA